MINIKDVVTMKLPFPNLSAELANRSHMYICLEEGASKVMLKCQREKPTNIDVGVPPFRRITETPNLLRNPFVFTTLIDCDKSFLIKDVIIDESLLAKNRRDISDEVHQLILEEFKNNPCHQEIINKEDICSVNRKITIKS
ncbi:hypothetical protein WKH57_00810 [Niallia taxi]|uniref:hypothetical protein n=1 Tax=Niallia taxi TaxID=2499688 RepID=UPI0031719E8B